MNATSLAAALLETHEATDRRFALLPDERVRHQFDDALSPAGWHYGHAAAVLERWVLGACKGDAPLAPAWDALFTPDETPKGLRAHLLPSRAELVAYVARVRDAAQRYLRALHPEHPPALLAEGKLGWFVLGHEQQHAELMTYVLALAGVAGEATVTPRALTNWSPGAYRRIPHAGGRFVQGTDERVAAYDNERCAHAVAVGDFALDEHPASNAHLAAFVADGGYHTRALWSEAGWQFRTALALTGPRHWGPDPLAYARERLHPRCPAERLSQFEAEAYARWAGGRLPTESEWERAARGDHGGTFPWGDALPDADRAVFDRLGPDLVDAAPGGATPRGVHGLAGGVWEWTATSFEPYPGFAPYPYPRYSASWFDGAHYVLRGGAWSTQGLSLRATFRNWYTRDASVIPSGVRLAWAL